MAPMVATLVAGPAIRNTSATAGGSPAETKDAAIGTDAVAQTYSGIEKSKTSSMAGNSPAPLIWSNKGESLN